MEAGTGEAEDKGPCSRTLLNLSVLSPMGQVHWRSCRLEGTGWALTTVFIKGSAGGRDAGRVD